MPAAKEPARMPTLTVQVVVVVPAVPARPARRQVTAGQDD
jgi:hypothetical protein